MDWTQTTESQTQNGDFAFLKAEGAIGYEWMDFYGNISLENPIKSYNDDPPSNQRYTAYGDLDIAIKEGLKLHIQNFYLHGKSFYVNDFVLGFAYKYQHSSGLWIKPFIGLHHTTDTYFQGLNGYMAGWVLNSPLKLFDNNFTLFWWNEIEFARDKSFYEAGGVPIGDSKSHGLNGGASFWWNITNAFATGVEYRYAQHKLGFDAYQSAYIYTVKYNF